MEFKIEDQQDKEALKKYIDALPEGKVYKAEVILERHTRTVSQNKLYHLWLNYISRETGNSVDSLHRHFAKEYIGYDIVEVLGEKQYLIHSTAKLKKDQFAVFLDNIQAEMADFGLVLPNPDDAYFSQFMKTYNNG